MSEYRNPFQGAVSSASQEVLYSVTSKIPQLAAMTDRHVTLEEYVSPALEWGVNTLAFPKYSKKMLDKVCTQIDRIYGPETAQGVRNQLHENYVAESATHLSFPRDWDHEGKAVSDDNTLVTQGILLSAAVYRSKGLQYHIGAYSGHIPFNNTNSPRYLQFGDEGQMIPVVQGNRAKGLCSSTPALNTEDLARIQTDFDKYIYQKRFQTLHAVLEELAPNTDDDRVGNWRSFFSKDKGYAEKNARTVAYVSGVLKEEFGMELDLFEADEQRMASVLGVMKGVTDKAEAEGYSVTFADQAIAAQSFLLNEIMPEGIEQVIFDFSDVVQELMIEALRDPTSLTHKIFADEHRRDTFVESLANTRTGWRYISEDDCESPFLQLRTSKGVTKQNKVSYSQTKEAHTPEELADMMERGEIVPTVAMECIFAYAETGMMFHGGMFQCQYAHAIKNGIVTFLEKEMGGEYDMKARVLRDMPTHIATQSAAFAITEDGELARYSHFLQRGNLSETETAKIVNMPARDALLLASPTLLSFLDQSPEEMKHQAEQVVTDLLQKGTAMVLSSEQLEQSIDLPREQVAAIESRAISGPEAVQG